jgi:DNA polymerase V
MSQRGIALIVANNFTPATNVSLIQAKRPTNCRAHNGCAIARNAEAKALGIKMGEPWFKLRDSARQHGIIALFNDYALYADMINR